MLHFANIDKLTLVLIIPTGFNNIRIQSTCWEIQQIGEFAVESLTHCIHRNQLFSYHRYTVEWNLNLTGRERNTLEGGKVLCSQHCILILYFFFADFHSIE